MKNFFAAALLIAAAALSFSCTKEPETQEPKTDPLIFIATTQQFEPGTRTQLVAGDIVKWFIGDEIMINSVPYRVSLLLYDDDTRAFFEKEGSVFRDPTPPFKAYYPSLLVIGGNVALPAQQTWVENRLTSVPMYAESNDIQLTFKNICALFELTIVGDNIQKVSKIEVSTTDKALWGPIEITNNVASIQDSGLTDANKLLTLDCGENGAVLTSEGTKFWIALPAGTYDNLTFKVYGDQEDQYYKMSTTGSRTILANHIYTAALTADQIKIRSDVAVTNWHPDRGTVSIKDNKTTAVKEGTIVTIILSPGTDYPVPNVSAISENREKITIYGTGNERTFEMPSSDVKVSVDFYPAPVADMLDAAFNLNGTATDLSPRHMGISTFGAPNVIDVEDYRRCIFTPSDAWGVGTGNFYKINYETDADFKSALADGHTLECIVMGHPASTTGEAIAFGSFESGGTGIEVQDNRFCFPVYCGYEYKYARSLVQPEDGVYYHLIGVYNREQAMVEIYVNGVLSGSSSAEGEYKHPESGRQWFCIGADPYDDTHTSYGWNGGIVMARIYSNPINAAEAAYLYEHRNDKFPTTGSFNGHDWVQLWKGGPRWAKINLGADDSNEYYGEYFAWGETTSEGPNEKKNYSYSDKPSTLPLSADAARANWGSPWRMPTEAEWNALIGKCNIAKTIPKKFTGRGDYSNNSISLPAAGYRSSWSVIGPGTDCYYWSSSLSSEDSADAISFHFTNTGYSSYGMYRYTGRTIRPISD